MRPARRGGKSRGRRGRPAQIYVRAASRRRRLWRFGGGVILVLLAAGATWYALAEGRSPRPSPPPDTVRVLTGRSVIIAGDAAALRRRGPAGQRRWLARVPDRGVRRKGKATIRVRLDRATLERRLGRALREGGNVQTPYRAVSATISLPIVKQALRNNCETAALSMLLRARGISVGQLALQRQLPGAQPRDPRGGVWGDPTRGFVGRPEGGGPAGGYGVYEEPITDLAARRGARLRRLSGRPPSAIYRALLHGDPVMTWVGLSNGPFRTWRTPAGKKVIGNLGEHTVVLTGLSRARIRVTDPLTGTVKRWTRAGFEIMWARLGRRAVSAPAQPPGRS